MKIAILMGGNSSEREISLETGAAVLSACKKLGFSGIACPYQDSIYEVISVLKEADIVFNALHGGEGEGGGVQKILDKENIKYTGSDPRSSELVMDKHRSKSLMLENNLPTPPWLHIDTTKVNGVDFIDAKFGYPVVVKPNSEGSTIGVTIVKSSHELDRAMDLASEFGKDILVEKYISGKEITVGILGELTLPIIEILPSHEMYDYNCKYTSGMSKYICPADLSSEITEKISEASLQIAKLLGCKHYCRVDFRLDNRDNFYCLEVNTLPGMTSTSLVPKAAKVAGISFEQLIQRILEFAIHG